MFCRAHFPRVFDLTVKIFLMYFHNLHHVYIHNLHRQAEVKYVHAQMQTLHKGLTSEIAGLAVDASLTCLFSEVPAEAEERCA